MTFAGSRHNGFPDEEPTGCFYGEPGMGVNGLHAEVDVNTMAPGFAAVRRQSPLYALVTEVMRRAVRDGSIQPGTVILEGPVAAILRCTRTPVRQALSKLEEEGLLHRFEGRGYLTGRRGTAPKRIPLTPRMLGVSAEAQLVRRPRGWEAIHDAVERDVVHLSVFGRYRLNELELARHFGVGRTAARDTLLRLESLGLLEKDERRRWTITPLDGPRINHLYELRWLLEPAALHAAFASGVTPQIERMAADLRRAVRGYPKVTPSVLDELEHDLHVRLLSRCPNKDLLHSLQRTRCLLTLSKHALGVSAPMPELDPFMAEHLAVLQALMEGDCSAAEAALRLHLEASCAKVTERARLVRSAYAKPSLPYIEDR
jgi:DNA-binding GntR family transcriptional regulator